MGKLLGQEVEELTSFIREFGEWSEIRGVIQSGGHDPDSDLLASFTESEEGEEWGVVVTKMRMVFEWFRNTDADPPTPVWREITGDPDLLADYPQIQAAFYLLKKRKIPKT